MHNFLQIALLALSKQLNIIRFKTPSSRSVSNKETWLSIAIN